MKRLLVIAGALSLLALVIAGAVLLAVLNPNRMIARAVNTHGPAFMKTEVHVGEVEIQLFGAQAKVDDIYIGSPPGFTLPKLLSAKTVHLALDRLSLLGNPLVIDRLEIESPDIAYEKTGRTDNFKALLKNMESPPSGAPDSPADNAAAATATTAKKKKNSRKVVIRDLIIRNAQVTAIFEPPGGRKLSLTLPELHLQNVGGSSGARPDKLVRQVLTALYEKILTDTGPVSRVSGPAGDQEQPSGTSFKKGIDKAAGSIKKLFGK